MFFLLRSVQTGYDASAANWIHISAELMQKGIQQKCFPLKASLFPQELANAFRERNLLSLCVEKEGKRQLPKAVKPYPTLPRSLLLRDLLQRLFWEKQHFFFLALWQQTFPGQGLDPLWPLLSPASTFQWCFEFGVWKFFLFLPGIHFSKQTQHLFPASVSGNESLSCHFRLLAILPHLSSLFYADLRWSVSASDFSVYFSSSVVVGI